jgi:hypothetical protein
MRKIIYGLLLLMASMSAVTSCTEEEVKPKNETGSSAGGGEIEQVKKN